MVEFGLVLPVLFMLTVGVLDVGRAFYQYNSLSNAAREAARFAAVQGGSQHIGFDWYTPYNGNTAGTYSQASGHPPSGYLGTQTMVGTAAAAMPGFDLTSLSIAISTGAAGPVPGGTIKASFVYTFQPATTLFLGGPSFPIVASSEMVIE